SERSQRSARTEQAGASESKGNMKKGAKELQPHGGNQTYTPVKSSPFRAHSRHSRKSPAAGSPMPFVPRPSTPDPVDSSTKSHRIPPNPIIKIILFLIPPSLHYLRFLLSNQSVFIRFHPFPRSAFRVPTSAF